MDEYKEYVWSLDESLSFHSVADAAEMLTHKARASKTPLFAKFNGTRMEAHPDKPATWCLHTWILNEARDQDAYIKDLQLALRQVQERLQEIDDKAESSIGFKAVARAAELRGARKILACETVLKYDEGEFVYIRRDKKVHEAFQMLKGETLCASAKSDAD